MTGYLVVLKVSHTWVSWRIGIWKYLITSLFLFFVGLMTKKHRPLIICRFKNSTLGKLVTLSTLRRSMITNRNLMVIVNHFLFKLPGAVVTESISLRDCHITTIFALLFDSRQLQSLVFLRERRVDHIWLLLFDLLKNVLALTVLILFKSIKFIGVNIWVYAFAVAFPLPICLVLAWRPPPVMNEHNTASSQVIIEPIIDRVLKEQTLFHLAAIVVKAILMFRHFWLFTQVLLQNILVVCVSELFYGLVLWIFVYILISILQV